MKKRINILIIGGTGFIGYHLSKKCIEKKWSVTSLSTKKPKRKRYLKKVNYVLCDISKKNQIKSKIKKYYDYVVNLGGHVDHKNLKKTYQSHYLGVKNLVEIFLLKRPKLFLQMGSAGEYGKISSPHKEKHLGISSSSIYNNSKLLASKFLLKLFEEKGFPVTILRLYQAYGPKQDTNRLIPIVIASCIKNKKFGCSNGKQIRDFIYIEDVIKLIMKCFSNKSSIKGQIINLGSGKPIMVKKLIEKIRLFVGQGFPQFGKIKMRKDEVLKSYPSILKARKKLNWKPKVSLDRGLNLTIKSFK